jgi:hypothetical protein
MIPWCLPLDLRSNRWWAIKGGRRPATTTDVRLTRSPYLAHRAVRHSSELAARLSTRTPHRPGGWRRRLFGRTWREGAAQPACEGSDSDGASTGLASSEQAGIRRVGRWGGGDDGARRRHASAPSDSVTVGRHKPPVPQWEHMVLKIWKILFLAIGSCSKG